MSKTPDFSLVCVLYYSNHLVDAFLENAAKMLDGSLRQVIFINNSADELILTKDYCPIEVLVINSGSNIGYGAALNMGIIYAKFSTLILCNPDIQFNRFNWPCTINNHKHFLLSGIVNDSYRIRRMPDLFNLFSNYAFLRMYGKLVYPLLLFRRSNRIAPDKELTKVDWFSGCFIITTKDTLDELKGFDETFFLFFEETDLFRRALVQNIPLFISKKIGIKTKNEKSSSIDVNSLKRRAETESLLKYINKHYKPVVARSFMYALSGAVYTNICLLGIFISLFHSKNAKLKQEYFSLVQNVLKKSQSNSLN